ncbi:aspartate/glutamate racemase family protein [Noviherbaspirillum sp.]|uniref:maleate cis-trans isomerase family protein n=1 Tax=Noviherbaspirillum sp. TaxID=1926288 RepID=UPI002B4707E0|nr:aspartate/glutamate racemase family protein [Noviherbaspirillum sp.]HJV82376.1 aspartate/glutamate racemase family protein [Noviherbaspirillum sp.]
MYGWRGRIGLLVPSINTTMETEFWRIAPRGVSVHSARIAGGRHGTPEELRNMENASKHAASEVAMIEPDVVVYGCTSGSFFEGPEWNEKICAQLTEITKAPTVTTAGAMAACLQAGGHRKVDVVTPYVELTNDRLKAFLKRHDIEVGKLGTFDMLDMFDHAKILPEEIYSKVKETITPDSEAVFVACTQLRALEVLDLLERDLGKPVYSAVQASAWQAYQAMGIDPGIDDCGSLLRKLSGRK